MLEHAVRLFAHHVRDHTGLYVFLVVLFSVGVAFGALATGALDESQRLELVQYLEFFLEVVDTGSEGPPAGEVFQAALSSNLRTTALVFLLGLTVVGAPLVPVVVFLRGFIVGFAVGFLVSHLGWSGMLMALLAILPQNLLLIPALLVLSAYALLFAATVIRRRGTTAPWRAGVAFTVITAVTVVTAAAASLVEGYVAPLFLRLIARWWT